VTHRGKKSFIEEFIESGEKGMIFPTKSKNIEATRQQLIRQKAKYPGGDDIKVVSRNGVIFLINLAVTFPEQYVSKAW
jgi:hypothetical protein